MIYFYPLSTIIDATPGVVTLDVSWATDVLALLGIISAVGTLVALWIRHEVKKNFNEIKSEFKPNGGGSLKDQVNRLEERHDNIDDKVDTLEKRVIKMDSKVDTILDFLKGKPEKN